MVTRDSEPLPDIVRAFLWPEWTLGGVHAVGDRLLSFLGLFFGGVWRLELERF